jgi:hypothetical protein
MKDMAKKYDDEYKRVQEELNSQVSGVPGFC